MTRVQTKLTETACKNAQPDTKLWDSEIKGFALFVGKTRKTFYFQKDIGGKTTRTKLGVWPEAGAADARYEASLLVAEHASGAVAKRLRDARVPTLVDALETYLARPKLRSELNKKLVRNQIEGHLATWLNKPLDEISKSDCVKAHNKVTKAGKVAANQALKSFRSVYNHARRVYELPECPTMAVEFHVEPPSQQIIDDLDEWRKVVDGLDNPVHQAFYRFLLFTGLRRSEALSLRWDQVHDDYLHLPETKNGRAFDLPLFDLHFDVIEPMQAYKSEFVFHGQRHAVHLKEPERIEWSPHAHRRTFGTFATTDAGLLEETVGRLLNHTPRSVTGARYVVFDRDKLRKPMGQVVDAFKLRHLI